MIETILNETSKITHSSVDVSDDLKFEATALNLSYLFLGHRDYTHGSSMLEGMLLCAGLLRPTLTKEKVIVRQFKVIKQFDTKSRAEAMSSANTKKHPRLKATVARLDLDIEGERITVLLFPTEETIEGRLVEYSAGDYVAELEFNSEGASYGNLHRVKDYIDLIRGLNEINRQITVMSFSNPEWSKRVRWAYIRDIPYLLNDKCSQVKRVSYEITDNVDLGEHRFEIKKGRFEDLDIEFQICFFIELPQD
jgi:hypothetical protein